MEKRERFGRVCERHWPFTRRIECCEEEDEQRKDGQVSRIARRDEEGKGSCQQRPSHVGESEEKQCAASEGIDGSHRRPRKAKDTCQLNFGTFIASVQDLRKVDKSEPPRDKESLALTVVRRDEQARGIECDNIDWHMLETCISSDYLENLLPHICCAIITTKEAKVARRTRGMVNSWMNRVTYLPLRMVTFSPSDTRMPRISPSPSIISSSRTCE